MNLKDYVSVVHHTAHPHMDPDGTVYGLGMTAGKNGAEYAIIEFPRTKRGEEQQFIAITSIPYYYLSNFDLFRLSNLLLTHYCRYSFNLHHFY